MLNPYQAFKSFLDYFDQPEIDSTQPTIGELKKELSPEEFSNYQIYRRNLEELARQF